jgi:nitrile hydratase subunit beta
MDGIHDLGGMDGFGCVGHTRSEPVFAEDWERRALRVTLAVNMAVSASGPAFRHSIERMDPAHYLTSSYYEHWLTAVSTLAVEAGVTSQAELVARAGGAYPLSRPARPAPPAGAVDARTEPRFALGQRVRVRDLHPLGHTRAPRYVRGKAGTVTRVDGAFNYPDLEAVGDRVLDPTYSVAFTSRDLWGEGSADVSTVHVDLWERYLEAEQ